MAIPLSESRSMSERSNLYSSLPDVLSIVKAFDRVQLRITRHYCDSLNVDTFGRNCWGSPIQIRCSTTLGFSGPCHHVEYVRTYLREQARPKHVLRELGQPPRPKRPLAQHSMCVYESAPCS